MAEQEAGVGQPDAVLLAPLSEDTFLHNLHVRYKQDLIYTYVAESVVSVNPCRALPLYSAEAARRYATGAAHALPPHVYAAAAAAWRAARDQRRPQWLVVTGESGAGKTEAARVCLQHLLLAAPPPPARAAALPAAGTLLEAFGNAATPLNHNASRFGKLLEIELDFKGEPVSGHITHYLLEKGRACGAAAGERNFHVFYQLLAGADVALLKRLKLQRSWEQYRILRGAGGGAGTAAARHDADHLRFTEAAMRALGLPDTGAVLRLLAFMLKLGNVTFEPEHNIDGSIGTRLHRLDELREACALVGADADRLAEALAAPAHPPHLPAEPTDDDAEERGATSGEYCGSAQWAAAALDRVLGALYSRLFTWLVQRANAALAGAGGVPGALLAILDLYGFEALADNGLERLLINYAAERLQEEVGAGAVRRAREEALFEGVAWCAPEPAPADASAADLLEGVLAALQHAAAHRSSDAVLLARLRRLPHPRLQLHPPDGFTVRHFGGAVLYSAGGMVCKNRDAVCAACGGVLGAARDPLLAELFSGERAPPSPRRPPSQAARQRALVAALVRRLPPAPRLVRCLRADAQLRPHRFDKHLLRHQLRSQGIVEAALARRAGWCEAVCARALLARFAVLAPSPAPRPAPEEAVRAARDLLRSLPIPSAEFAFGHTKVFIRSPRTMWELEALRAARVDALVAAVQRLWRRRRAAARGAGGAAARLWRWWCVAARRRYLLGLWARLPARHRSPACGSWPAPTAPRLLARTDALLRALHHAWRCRVYRAAFDQSARNRMREKVTASVLFRGRKASYAGSVAHPFVGDYVRLRASGAWRRGAPLDRYVVFADAAGKVARASGRVSPVLCVLSTAALLLLEPRSLRVRRRVPAHLVRRLSLSPYSDDVLVVHVRPDNHTPQPATGDGCLFGGEGGGGGRARRGDVVVRATHVLELATKLFLVVQNAVGAPPAVNIASEFEADFGSSIVTVAFHALGGIEGEGGGVGGARLLRRADRMDVLL